MRVTSCIAAIGVTLMLAACGGMQTHPEIKTGKLVGEQELSPAGEWLAARNVRGDVQVSYYDQVRKLWLADERGTRQIAIDNDEMSSPSGLAMAADRETWLAYRDKFPQKALYLVPAASDDKAKFPVSGNSEPLARMEVHGVADGARALWYGEKNLDGKSAHSYWVNYAELHNGRASAVTEVLPGIYPVWINAASGDVAVFSWYSKDGGHRIAMRKKAAGGEFGPEIKVADTSEIVPVFSALEAGKRWLVYWVAQYGDKKTEYLIEGAWSDDQGQNWSGFTFPALRGFDVESISHAVDGKGNVVLAVGGDYGDDDSTDRKQVYLLVSNDNGSTWRDPVKFRDEAFRYAHVHHPEVAFLPGGELLLLTQDWRSIRSELRYSLSRDAGASWIVQDARLPLDPAKGYGLRPASQSIHSDENGIDLVVEQFDDGFLTKQLLTFRTSLKELERVAKDVEVVPGRDRLIARVNAFGAAMVKGDYQTAYQFFDPFYRKRVDFMSHLTNIGRIKYKSYEFSDAKSAGNLALVLVHVVASVPSFESASGKRAELAERDVEFPARWVWVDGDWYMEFYSEAKNLRYARY